MKSAVIHFVRYQLPAAVWAISIFILSSIPAHKLPKLALMVNDKIVHAATFLILGLLVYRALEPKVKTQIFNFRRLLTAVGAVIVYAFIDEFHQSFVPGRKIDIRDASADAVGAVIAGVIIYLYASRKRKLI